MRAKHYIAPLIGFTMANPAWANTAEQEKFDARTLARALFPIEQAVKIESLEINEPVLPGMPDSSVTLFSKAEAIAPGVCHRESYHVSLPLSPEVPASWTTRWHHVALGSSCRSAAKRQFAQIQPMNSDPREAAKALAWFGAAVRAPKRGYTLRCIDKTARDLKCSQSPENALADLPVDRLFIISNEGAHRWNFTLSAGRPGGLVWSVDASEIDTATPAITMTKLIPPPF